MPPLPPVPGVLRVREIWNNGSDADIITHHYVAFTGTDPTTAELIAFCAAVQSSMHTHFAGAIHSTVSSTLVEAEDLTSSSSSIGSSSVPWNGTAAGHVLVGSAGMNVQSVIARRYRGGKPRTCWPFGESESLTSPQLWSGAFVTGVATEHAAFEADVLAAGWSGAGTLSFVNVSYFEGFTSVQNPVTMRWRNVAKLRVGGPVVDPVLEFVLKAQVGQVSRRG